ncbi:helix-turn-helix domain-containing protein [Paenibacillus hexagrammi]|uniref:AraC family transcriptional regulator n=1 Tax=Paenibacillus hexagrammi TaxID=2908839 RepID=A0ABY3SES3_9BACL|nr:AraC family transcriptional regulator [Paenibacillus sp. YPD9-1]UJF32497.1 AraC family transcriptional regulator [Paenibacillus sp. YPD9-1]
MEQPHSSNDWQPKIVHLANQVQQIETLEDLAGLVAQVIQQYVESSPTRKAPRSKVQQIQEYIAAHYDSNELSLASVAKEFFISSGYLSMRFKQDLGINFLDYIHQYRVEQSKILLKNGDMKIQSIAKAVGYCDEAHYSKTFKKWTGMAPSQYQKSQILMQ